MAKSIKGMVASAVETEQSDSGFYLYDDGASFWGINLIRFGNAGVKITEELHKKTADEKLAWLKEYLEKKAEADKQAEAAKKAKEVA